MPRLPHILVFLAVILGVVNSGAVPALAGEPQLNIVNVSVAFLAPALALPFLFGLSYFFRRFGMHFIWWLLLFFAAYLVAGSFTGVARSLVTHVTLPEAAIYNLVIGGGSLVGLYLACLALRLVGQAPNYSLKRTAADRLR